MPSSEAQRLMVAGRDLRVTSLDKVMYPETGTTKLAVLEHYIAVADAMLPHLRHRPVTRVRWPHGVGGTHFFEKNLPSGAPRWLNSVSITGHGSRSDGASVTYPLITDLADLIYLANLGSLEFHVPQWQIDSDGRPKKPDRLVIDLDPGRGAGLTECAQVALLVRDHVSGIGLELQAVTSGSKGMQLYAELEGQRDAREVSDVAKSLAQYLTKAHPRLGGWQMTQGLRTGKVFIDWSQNVAAKTTICPWSLRGRPQPQVATPRQWQEIEASADESRDLTQVSITQVAEFLPGPD
ncbi:MAG: non-homologous end-joining DNA ligase [Ornithinimicrobium sp.]